MVKQGKQTIVKRTKLVRIFSFSTRVSASPPPPGRGGSALPEYLAAEPRRAGGAAGVREWIKVSSSCQGVRGGQEGSPWILSQA